VADALARMSAADRDVLLAAWASLSDAEMAESLGIPVDTVRSRLHRARRQLLQALPDNGALKVLLEEHQWMS
jgi:RNA polymerase sigma factor (sigma-70 family)